MPSESVVGRGLRAWLLGVVVALMPAVGLATSDPQDAESVVRAAAAEVFDAVNADRAGYESDPTRLYAIIYRIVLPHFDFRRMSQRVLGKHWRQASADQQQRFERQFEALLVRTYATAVREYSTLKIDFLPLRVGEGGKRVTVRTQVQTLAGLGVPISYEMYATDDGWKVYDVSIEGISLVINYRSSFSSEIRAGGIDGLIERLSHHNHDDVG